MFILYCISNIENWLDFETISFRSSDSKMEKIAFFLNDFIWILRLINLWLLIALLKAIIALTFSEAGHFL